MQVNCINMDKDYCKSIEIGLHLSLFLRKGNYMALLGSSLVYNNQSSEEFALY